MEPNMTARGEEPMDQHEVPSSSSAGNLNYNAVTEDATESLDLITQREKIQQQILALEKYFDAEGHSGLSACSSTDGESEDGDEDLLDDEKGLDAQHLKIQREIRELEETLGLGAEDHLGDNVGSSDIPMSDEDSDDEDFELPMNAETCLEMNLVYQEVVNEKLAELEQLLQDNQMQQKELENQMHGPAAPNPATGLPSTKVMFIGNFMKPYFKDRVTGLGPPANPETKEKTLSGKHPCDEKCIRRWEGWQKSLLINAIVQDTMKRLLQPKLSKMEYLRDKASKAGGVEKETLQKQIEELEEEIANIRVLGEEDLMGGRNDDHDWEKIANIDFEGKREAEDLKLFWQNYLHPSINKSSWKPDEIEKLKSIVEEHEGHNWETIAEKMETNRTAFMCFQTHQRYIYKEFRKRVWTKEEDKRLRELVQKKRIGNFIPYTQISYFMDGRDSGQLVYRWTQVLDPNIKRGPWSKREDKMLLKSVEKHGIPNWWRIKYDVPGRTDSQCRDRYLDCLSDNVRKGPWTTEEENLLRLGVQKYGVGKWSKIASEIPYRIDSQCMQKWKSLNRNTIPRRGYSNSQIPKVKGKKRKPKPKRNGRRRRSRRVNVEDNHSDSEIVYMDSDEERDSEDAASDKEREHSRLKYIQTPFSEWIPRQTGKTMPTTGRLHMFLVKSPEDTEEVDTEHPQLRFKNPAYYTILNNAGFPVNRIRRYDAQHQQTSKKRTFDEDMILVPQGDVKKLYQLVVTRAFKLRQQAKGQESTANQSTERPSKPSDTGPSEGPNERASEATGEGPNKATGESPNEGASEDTGEGARKRSSAQSMQGRTEVRPIIYSQYVLKAAISPWMGHLLLPLSRSERQKLEADVVRERAAEVILSSTQTFLLFLTVLHVDTVGCRKVIAMRNNTVGPGINRSGVHSWQTDQTSQRYPTYSHPSQPIPIRHPHPQPVLIPIRHPQHPHQDLRPQWPQWAQRPPPRQTRLPQLWQAPRASPQFALQMQPCERPPMQPQLRIPQMPRLLIPHGVRLAQPVLLPLPPRGKPVAGPIAPGSPLPRGPVTIPSTRSEPVSTQSTCREPVSTPSKGKEPVSSQATCSTSPSDSEAEGTRPSKRTRKPTDKAKLLMEEAAAKAKNQQRHKRPRLEGPSSTPPPPSPVALIIAPSAQVPMNTVNGSKLVGTCMLPCPPSPCTTSSSPAASRSTTPQANMPLKITGMFPSGVVFALPNAPAPTSVMRPAAVPMPSLPSNASTSNTTVTTSLSSVQGRGSSLSSVQGRGSSLSSVQGRGSPFISHIPASALATPPAFSVGPGRAHRPHPFQGGPRVFVPSPGPVLRAPGPPHPVGFLRALTPVVAFPQPAVLMPRPVAQKQPALPDFSGGFDPSLMFLEDRHTVQAWIKKRKGMVFSPSDHTQSYLPPFVSALNTLQSLLMAKAGLLKHSLKVLPNNPKEATSSTKAEEQVDAVRSLVREKFGSNPAYQILKARFLSCFAVPALLATIDPTKNINQSDDEDEDEDDNNDND